MTIAEYTKLKNGTAIYGTTDEKSENASPVLTNEAAERIAKAFCVWLISRTGKTKVCVAVGYDSRKSSPALCETIVNGITSTGHDAVVTGLSLSPSMFASLNDEKWQAENHCHGAIMITGGHFPTHYNGMKFFSPKGGLEESDINELLEMAANYRFACCSPSERIEKNYLDKYALSLVEKVRVATGEETPLANKKIVVDASNGAGNFYATKVLIPLGANVSGSPFLNLDSSAPNYVSIPEQSIVTERLCNAVLSENAELGISFDADAGKSYIVDKNGKPIQRNRFIALLSAIVLQEQPGTIVTDPLTSNELTAFIEGLGGKHLPFSREYGNVIQKATELNQAAEYTPLALDTDGNAAFKENGFFCDGAFLIGKVLISLVQAEKDGKTLTDFIDGLVSAEESIAVEIPFMEECDFRTLGQQIVSDFAQHVAKSEYAELMPNYNEGCRVNYHERYGNGWAMVYANPQNPVLSIYIESFSKLLKIEKDLYYFLSNYPCLDVSPLKKLIHAERRAMIENLKAEYINNPDAFSFLFHEEQNSDIVAKKTEEPQQLILAEVTAVPVSEEEIPEDAIAMAEDITEEETVIEVKAIVVDETNVPESEIAVASIIEETSPEAEQLSIEETEITK